MFGKDFQVNVLKIILRKSYKVNMMFISQCLVHWNGSQ